MVLGEGNEMCYSFSVEGEESARSLPNSFLLAAWHHLAFDVLLWNWNWTGLGFSIPYKNAELIGMLSPFCKPDFKVKNLDRILELYPTMVVGQYCIMLSRSELYTSY